MKGSFAYRAAVFALALAVPASAHANFDVFESETLNDLDAFGMEIPYTSGAPRQFTASFNTSTYGLDTGEGDEIGNLNGCLKPGGPVFAGRTAWARFNPDVAGSLHVIAQTPGYDSIVWIREARQAQWKTTTFSDVRGRPNNCSDLNTAAGDEETVLDAGAQNVYYVQVGGKCSGDRTTCGDPGVPGGATTIRLTFTPSDSDSDGVPDTTDNCPGEGLAGAVTDDGCPDTDGDNIADSEEGPGCVGQDGVPADPPYNGCFDGPDPPRPGVGASVIIESLNGDHDNTSDVDVRLRLNWPKGAREAFANNSAGDDDVEIPLDETVPWRLRRADRSETREVEVRFRGPNINDKDSDTITLDPEPPKVRDTLLIQNSAGRWFIGAKLVDPRNGSGVETLDVFNKRKKRIQRLKVCRRGLAPAATRRRGHCDLKVDAAAPGLPTKPAFVRTTDAAGNRSKRKNLASDSGGCRILVPLGGIRITCVKLGDGCRHSRRNPPYWSAAFPSLKCNKRNRVRKL